MTTQGAETSPEIDKLAPALVRAVNAIEAVKKDNQGHGYKYADLASCLDEARRVLAGNGLTVMQPLGIRSIDAEAGAGGECVPIVVQVVRTIVMHESGQWIASETAVPEGAGAPKMSVAQAIGSAVTYMRRYSLCAMLSIATEDDDGAGAGDGRHRHASYPQPRRDDRRPPAPSAPRRADAVRDELGDAFDGHHAKNFAANASGHGSGAYAKPEVVKEYQEWSRRFVEEINLKWLDHAQAKHGLDRVKDLLNDFQLRGHLYKWGASEGLFDAPPEKRASGDKYAAIAFDRDPQAVEAEAVRYCRELWRKAAAALAAPADDDDAAEDIEDAAVDAGFVRDDEASDGEGSP